MDHQATNKRPIILCPGQGAQHVGMGKSWADKFPIAAETFAHADQALGIELTKLCFDGPQQELDRTDIAQAAIYTTSVACYRALGLSKPIATAGLSLGEFTALHLAGAFDFETGLKLVRMRGQAMQDAAEATASHGASGMVALVGADEAQAEALCEEALNDPENKGDEVLVTANFNCPGQVVISGTAIACNRAMTVADKMGLRATGLKVAGAFHSPLMQPAADRLAKTLDQVTWSRPACPVVSNVTARPHDSEDIESIKQRLVEQLTSPVRWGDSISWLIDNVQGEYVELAPNRVLTGLMRRIDRKTKVQNHAEPK